MCLSTAYARYQLRRSCDSFIFHLVVVVARSGEPSNKIPKESLKNIESGVSDARVMAAPYPLLIIKPDLRMLNPTSVAPFYPIGYSDLLMASPDNQVYIVDICAHTGMPQYVMHVSNVWFVHLLGVGCADAPPMGLQLGTFHPTHRLGRHITICSGGYEYTNNTYCQVGYDKFIQELRIKEQARVKRENLGGENLPEDGLGPLFEADENQQPPPKSQ
nr:MAG: ORF3 [Tacheng Tick Virus 6]